MVLQTSGPIKFSQIASEFENGAPYSISEFYGKKGLPASGTIRVNDFYGKYNTVNINLTISSSTTNYNLKTALLAAGWNGTTAVICTCTINSGVTVYSTSTGTYAWQTGSSYPFGTELYLVNNGTILGRGGNGGAGGSSGSNGSSGSGGGPALFAGHSISITNNGRIAGGGGGAGGGGAAS